MLCCALVSKMLLIDAKKKIVFFMKSKRKMGLEDEDIVHR